MKAPFPVQTLFPTRPAPSQFESAARPLDQRDLVSRSLLAHHVHEGADQKQAATAYLLEVLRIEWIGQLSRVASRPFVANDIGGSLGRILGDDVHAPVAVGFLLLPVGGQLVIGALIALSQVRR